MFRDPKKAGTLASPYFAWALIFILVPLAMILWYGFTDDTGAFTAANIASILQPEHAKSLLLALELSILSTAI